MEKISLQTLKLGLHNCDQEPIHQIHQIQPFGYLIILSADLKLINYSNNLPDIFLSQQVFQAQFEKIFAQPDFVQWVNGKKLFLPFTFEIETKPFAATGFFDQKYLVLEIEPLNFYDNNSRETTSIYTDFGQSLKNADHIKEASSLLASFIQKILDYDRVMIYQFDEEWNGHVISEAVKPGIRSFYDHHFPATDIPDQARALLKKLKTRQIANVAATSVNLKYTTDSLNMELSHLRNPSQVHLQFLRNMSVQATLTFAVVNEGNLWGLVCAQHESAVYKDIFQRLLCQNLTDIFADALYYFREKHNEDILAAAKRKTDIFIWALSETQNLHRSVEQQNQVLRSIVDATGMAILLEGKIIRFGVTPSQKQIYNIIQKIPAEQSVFQTKKLVNLLPEAEVHAKKASGLLFIDFADSFKILWFRPEVDLTKTWAGDPEKPYSFAEDGFKINPRESFKSYQRKVRNCSSPWSATERAAANYFLETFDKAYLKLLYTQLNTSKEHLEIQNRKMVALSAMMAHDIKNPITSFKLLLDMYKSDILNRKEFIEKLENISQRLLSTSNDLSNLSGILASDIDKSSEISFTEIFHVTRTKLEGQILEARVEFVTAFDIDLIKYPPTYLESIMLNLVSNAIKYRSSERKPVIKISTFEDNGYVCLSVEDNGMGINLVENGKDIFGLYQTFHEHPEARGIGLYLTKSQVESMGGEITVKSAPDKGTKFNICLKKLKANA